MKTSEYKSYDELPLFLNAETAAKVLGIQIKYGITMPIRTVGEYLTRWGFTVQRPAKWEANQKPEQVETWLNEEYPSIHRSAKAENAEIFWGDETAVQNEANYARGYAPRGNTPIVKVRVENHKNEIALFYLPPYSPEYNPDEYLNNDLKHGIGTQAMVQDVRELEANASAFMAGISEDPDHVKSYFDHPALDKYKLD